MYQSMYNSFGNGALSLAPTRTEAFFFTGTPKNREKTTCTVQLLFLPVILQLQIATVFTVTGPLRTRMLHACPP
jgi:hypothetical protein